MTAISRIQASLASATQETTFALANLNFDFSLWKVEAPASYHPLGDGLSVQRRSAAENGMPHIIARRLGSLFETLLPSTPSLVHAYGTRASEISKSPGTNPSGSKAHGPFQRFVGLDGTSIWAAATSGSSAVAVHLLACMLARVWSPAEAVSIWEELVTERKKTLIPNGDGDEQSVPMKDVVAAQLAISKEQLAEWDASARAWLRAADASHAVAGNQKELAKILNQLSLPVGSQSMVYENVCKTWVTALTTVDKLVQGHPYSAQDGAVLLALSSWHIYPDLIVLGSSSRELRLGDSLVAPGGALTIGLQSSDPHASKGVYWSLSLAHLRYYGGPVMAQGRIDSESSRLTFPQFLSVALGAVMASWGLPTSQIQQGAKLVRLMKACLSTDTRCNPATWAWLRPLDAAASMQIAEPTGRDGPSKLVRLGHRRRSIVTGAHPNNIFHLRCMDLGCVLSPAHQAHFYRSIFRNWDHRAAPLVLRIHSDGSGPAFFATLVPERHGRQQAEPQYTVFGSLPSKPRELFDDSMKTYDVDDIQFQYSLTGREFTWKNPPSLLSSASAPAVSVETVAAQESSRSSWLFKKKKKNAKLEAVAETSPSLTFEFVGGDYSSVSLYCLKGHAAHVRQFGDSQVDIEVVLDALDRGQVDAEMLSNHISGLYERDDGKLIRSCLAIASASRLYECMPSATISPKILESPKAIADLNWAVGLARHGDEEQMPSEEDNMDRASAFSCIAYFESGFMDIPGQQYLENVMAISSGDSLYVAAPLVCDPASGVKPYEVHRVIGNIGRAGLAFLIPPQAPMVRSATSDSWRLVNHEPFDGHLEDNFNATTLHLGFTGYEVPLTLSDHGGRFVESFFIEAVVSVHDSGRWVADIDILTTLAASSLFSLVQQPTCIQSSPAGTVPQEEVVSLDNWEELLDPPNSAGVVRAHGNWQARLAAACVSVTLGHPTILFQQHGCWTCAVSVMESLRAGYWPRHPRNYDPNAYNDGMPGPQASFVFVL